MHCGIWPARIRSRAIQIHYLPLRLYVRLNVALRRTQCCVTRQHLHVPERAAYG